MGSAVDRRLKIELYGLDSEAFFKQDIVISIKSLFKTSNIFRYISLAVDLEPKRE